MNKGYIGISVSGIYVRIRDIMYVPSTLRMSLSNYIHDCMEYGTCVTFLDKSLLQKLASVLGCFMWHTLSCVFVILWILTVAQCFYRWSHCTLLHCVRLTCKTTNTKKCHPTVSTAVDVVLFVVELTFCVVLLCRQQLCWDPH